jgi:RND family efflux transporter MFP subunit
LDLPPARRAVASSRLAGTLRRLAVGLDQEVQAGQLLAEVDSLELQDTQLELLRTDLQVRLLGETLRSMRQSEGGAIPERTLRETESALATARQRRGSLRRKLTEMGLTAEDVRAVLETRKVAEGVPVRSPIRGKVVRLRAVLGQAVKTEDPLFDVDDLAGASVLVQVPERHLSAVRLDQAARVRLTAVPGFVGEGVLARSGRSLAAGSRSAAMWVDLKGLPSVPLPAGMMARVTVVVSEPKPALAVPTAAVLRDGSAAYLFVRRQDGSFERRPVALGRADDRFVEVVHGLAEGEPVAVSGVAALQNAYASLR